MSTKPGQNLLDNSVFLNGCLVDQRGGYVVPPGVDYYVGGGGAKMGTTTSYVPVTKWDGPWPYITVDGEDYVVAQEAAVRGYTGTRYAIDRWKSNSPYTTVLIKDDCVEVISTADSSTMGIFSQPTTLNELRLSPGDTVTLSFLSEVVSAPNGNIRLQIDNDTKSDYSQGAFLAANIGTKSIYSITKTIPETWEKTDTIRITMFRVGSFDVKEYAAKLELGTQQTLAHKDADGNWVLNELPNYADTLARCQRYFYKATLVFGTMLSKIAPNTAQLDIQFPVTMRTSPSLKIARRSIIRLDTNTSAYMDGSMNPITTSEVLVRSSHSMCSVFYDSMTNPTEDFRGYYLSSDNGGSLEYEFSADL